MVALCISERTSGQAMSRSITVQKIATSDPTHFVEVSVFFDDGSMRRISKGYWVAVQCLTDKGDGMILRTIFGGGSKYMLEPTTRFNDKKLRMYAAMDFTSPSNMHYEKVQGMVNKCMYVSMA